ncbi:MAG TPA: hypothetical protein V6D03_05980 [Candidatus Caenarcaniphilales bacterium]
MTAQQANLCGPACGSLLMKTAARQGLTGGSAPPNSPFDDQSLRLDVQHWSLWFSPSRLNPRRKSFV